MLYENKRFFFLFSITSEKELENIKNLVTLFIIPIMQYIKLVKNNFA